MSRAAKQDIDSSILVPIMFDTASTTNPASLIQTRTPFRAGDHATCVAGLGCVGLIDYGVNDAGLMALVFQHRFKG